MRKIDPILERLRASCKVKTDKEMCDILGLKYPTLDTWKNRDSIPHKRLKEFAEKWSIDLHWLETGYAEGNQTVIGSKGTVQQYGTGNQAGNVNVGGGETVREPGEAYTESELVTIPYYREVHGAMGEGGLASNAETTPMAFTSSFLRGMLGLDRYEGLHIINATGDSMAPTIKSGELIFVNPYKNEDNRVHDGAVYVIVCHDSLLIKRVRKNPIKKELTLISDNPDVDNIIMSSDEMNGCQIIGRVIGHFEKL